MENIQATQLCREFIRRQVKRGDLCIDGTAGNGHDTLLLSRLAGEDGMVLAFDVQEGWCWRNLAGTERPGSEKKRKTHMRTG